MRDTMRDDDEGGPRSRRSATQPEVRGVWAKNGGFWAKKAWRRQGPALRVEAAARSSASQGTVEDVARLAEEVWGGGGAGWGWGGVSGGGAGAMGTSGLCPKRCTRFRVKNVCGEILWAKK